MNAFKQMPLLSVIVPVYNVQDYLDVCIKSILLQTYRNIELIIVDDGSTDKSGEICDSYKLRDNRIIVIHKSNGGLSDARNAGLAVATGEYLGFVDSDDWVDCYMYEILMRELTSNAADISVCERVLFGDAKYVDYGETGKTEICDREKALDYLYQDEKYRSHVWNKLYRKELFDGIVFPPGKNFEDAFVMHRVFERASKVVFVDKGLYYYRQRSNSIVHTCKLEVWGDYIEALIVREKSASAVGREKQLFISWMKTVERIKRLDGKEIYVNGYRTNAVGMLLRRYSIRYGIVLTAKTLAISLCFPIYEYLRKNKSRIKKMALAFWTFHKDSSWQLDHKTDKMRIILMGSPEYNNLGDLAIAYSIKKIVNEILPDYQYVEIPEDIIKNGKLPSGITKKDLLLLVGGGNFGDVYIDQHNIRKRVLNRYKDHRIIVFPQTVFFSASHRGNVEKKELKRMIHNCKALSLYFREKKSYSKALELFDTSKIRICPDIVLYNNYQNENLRKDVLVCLRHDEESVMDDRDRQEILDCVFNLGRRVRMWDTCLAHGVSLAERDAVVEKGIREVSGYSLVVTDRLHCMIFCAITGTPCIALDNKNSKISSSYEWIKDLGFVSCVDDISLLESEAQRLMQIYPDGSPKRVDHELFRGLILDLTGH